MVEVLEGFYSFGFEVREDGDSAATGFAEVTSLEEDWDSPLGSDVILREYNLLIISLTKS